MRAEQVRRSGGHRERPGDDVVHGAHEALPARDDVTLGSQKSGTVEHRRLASGCALGKQASAGTSDGPRYRLTSTPMST
ncbi:hypothetical protein LK08_25025 [Streptomyces sp. MUSC 125]|nr:hypothetical protein LK08_25025 [Streptomyces sp. MUSC 125]